MRLVTINERKLDTMAKTLPKAPQHEGVDPLTKSPTYHSPENVKGSSTLNKQAEKTEPTKRETQAEETVQAQEERAVDPAGAKADSDNERGASDPDSSEPASTEGDSGDSQEPTADSESKTSSKSKK